MKKYGLFLILTLSLLQACRTPVAQTLPECPPPPPQNCQPGQWRGEAFDTSSIITGGRNRGYHWAISPVSGVNSSAQEWAMSFTGAREGFLTYSESSGGQRLKQIRLSADHAANIESEVFSEAGAEGNVSIAGNRAVMASVAAGGIKGDADIYIADVSNGVFKNGAPLTINQHVIWDSHPTLSPDGTVLFFASDRAGGFGGTDIWFSVFKNGGWTEPVNAGSTINTECDELSPFISRDGRTLLFSSSGHQTVGGYDLFSAQFLKDLSGFKNVSDDSLRLPSFKSSLFTAFKNIGAPINTAADEIFPSAPGHPDSLLYYASNQPSSRGGFDIFVLHKIPFRSNIAVNTPPRDKPLEKPVEELIEKPIETPREDVARDLPPARLEGTVINNRTKEPIEGADITVREIPDRTPVSTTKTDESGHYGVDIPVDKDVEVSAETGELFYDNLRLRVPAKDSGKTITHGFALPERLFLRINFPTNEFSNPYQFVLDSNGRETDQSWQSAIQSLAENLLKYSNIIQHIQFIGHTDDVGTNAANSLLGQRRVNFIISELEKRGVPSAMLRGRSAGENEPLTKRAGETQDDHRKRLRRVEMSKVLKK
ncbi:MAG TPA: OmpA family protein [Patescibacteria group bacterium]|nr:OmpA family protein [Patescibacteria group bacterium]